MPARKCQLSPSKMCIRVSISSQTLHSIFKMSAEITYLSGGGPPTIASLREVFPASELAWVVAVPTPGKFWRKFAINSSPGFCEDVL